VRQSLLKKFTPVIAVVLALTLYGAVNPFRVEHFALVALFIGLAVASRATRDLAVALVPAAIFGLVYDLLRLFADRSYHAVIVEPVYHLEQALFGWLTPEAGDLGPVDFFREHHHIAVDLLAGFWYSTHVPAVILFGLYLWWMHWREDGSKESKAAESRLHKFMWGYLAFNVLGFIVWIVFPVAAPWYVEQYGFLAPGEPILGDPAALGRVDQWLGYPHFSQIYEQGTYVFGAMPSLHVAPSFWIAIWARKTPLRVATWTYAAVMSFFAVYLGHHYIIDVLAGGLLAVAVYAALAHTRLGHWPERAAESIRASFSEIFSPEGKPEEARAE
jgi:membrane-associated phospholipid phosphatase